MNGLLNNYTKMVCVVVKIINIPIKSDYSYTQCCVLTAQGYLRFIFEHTRTKLSQSRKNDSFVIIVVKTETIALWSRIRDINK